MSDTSVDFDEAARRCDPVLGPEVHVELGTATKMFDATPNVFGAQPNTMVTPTSVDPPGVLPVINACGVEYAIHIGLALSYKIAQSCRFARKDYLYPDLAKDFQTSQSDKPIACDGTLEIEVGDGSFFTIPTERAHMKKDTGKDIHIGGADDRIGDAGHSLVDYNRVGVPLMEIVTRPIEGTGARAPQVATAYIRTLRNIFRAPGVSEARMERGNVHANVNVSLRELPDAPLGTRTETKNINTFRGIEQAVRYEIQRQTAILATGGEVLRETRHGQADGTTRADRIESDADDCRYLPEPDLIPVAPSREWVEEIRAGLPEVPAAKRRRLKAEWGLSDTEMHGVVNAGAPELIEATAAAGITGQAARRWWVGELSRTAKEQETALEDMTVTPEQIAGLQEMVDFGRLTNKLARQALGGILAGEGDPETVAAAHGLKVIPSDSTLLTAVDKALTANPGVANKIHGGRVQAAGATAGAVVKATRGQANTKCVRELIVERVQSRGGSHHSSPETFLRTAALLRRGRLGILRPITAASSRW